MKTSHLIILSALLALLSSCSTTKSIPDDDQLFIGLKGIKYDAPERGEHYDTTVEELEAALATAPNASLLGSSSLRSPLPIGLWIWNQYQGTESGFGKWMLKSFGTEPVLMSWVNPALRASVAKEVLRAHGYFRGRVDYEEITQKNPKKAKIAYKVNMGHLFTIDSLEYRGFPAVADSLITATQGSAQLHNGDAFDVSTLEGERSRLNTLLRNNGFYYYQPSYASYLADTVTVPGKVLLKFQQADSLPTRATRQWYIGKVDVDLRKSFMERLTDSIGRRNVHTHFNGRRPPVRGGVIFNAMKLKPGELYSYTNHEETLTRLTAAGLFNVVDMNFTPRDSTGLADTLDLRLNCVLDRPYDFYIETNVTGKTSNRVGPGVVIGLTKRNAFRGGELLDINLKGSYEWQTGHKSEGTSTGFESYEYGAEVSLQYPRIMVPFFDGLRRRLNMRRPRNNFYSTPSTTFKISTDIVSRADYFKRHVVSAEWTYSLQTSPTSRHQFSPLVLSYEYMRSTTSTYDSLVAANPYLTYTMADRFVPKMQYVYTYTSPSSLRNPIWWQTTVSEAANLLSLGYMAGGKKWGEKDKNMFGNPYAQFVKLETELVKTWSLSDHSTLVGHVDAGVIWSFGNSDTAPYSEQFYVGGANSIRAFNARYVGPGGYNDPSSANIYYLDRTGDVKFLANLEYRPRLLGNLYGALFLDAGNVWQLRSQGRNDAVFRLRNVLKEMALGTGVGLRYDLEFLVIRVDWGVALHVPYKSGFYNVDSFKDGQTLHFAIGYPF